MLQFKMQWRYRKPFVKSKHQESTKSEMQDRCSIPTHEMRQRKTYPIFTPSMLARNLDVNQSADPPLVFNRPLTCILSVAFRVIVNWVSESSSTSVLVKA